ncbi:hypothetical protein MMC21_002461 [Puttea exsequens]|nr:hypothetical protein [Puttea exsequens]
MPEADPAKAKLREQSAQLKLLLRDESIKPLSRAPKLLPGLSHSVASRSSSRSSTAVEHFTHSKVPFAQRVCDAVHTETVSNHKIKPENLDIIGCVDLRVPGPSSPGLDRAPNTRPQTAHQPYYSRFNEYMRPGDASREYLTGRGRRGADVIRSNAVRSPSNPHNGYLEIGDAMVDPRTMRSRIGSELSRSNAIRIPPISRASQTRISQSQN